VGEIELRVEIGLRGERVLGRWGIWDRL